MLTEERYNIILELLREKRSVTVAKIKDRLGISEPTIRRDLNALAQEGKLTKVFGGAVVPDNVSNGIELSVPQKLQVNEREKRLIAGYAAAMIKPHDFLYLDAGTTTGYMLEFFCDKDITVVTNAVAHAQRLAQAGVKVRLVGGELKSSTEAVVGSEAMQTLRKYHFTKGFFGTNGVTKKAGFTTPDANEAMVKKTAIEQCQKKYVLCDHSKFGEVSSVTFLAFTGADVITDRIAEGYQDCGNIVVIE